MKDKVCFCFQLENNLIARLHDNLAPLRAKAGLSQGELSKLVGISRQTYSAIESGNKTMSWNVYLSLMFFYYFNNATNPLLRQLGLYPDEFIEAINGGKTTEC
ncbi:MAG: helix-turn-helix domain-containing protein [Lachnospiraceae bacterium]|nr:helix-turn-helix domain-containing protein [Candidatus Minthocola equi]